MRTSIRLAALVGAVVFSVNCGGGGGTENNDPTPGDLTLSLATPNSNDGAIRLTITGPAAPTAVTAASAGLQVFKGALGTTTVVIVTGALADGPLLHITVPDTRKDEDYTVAINEVSSTAFAVVATTGYAVDVSK